MYHLDESHIFIFLVQIGTILLLARVVGELFRKIHQPVLTAELLIGILLGPTVLGRFLPNLFNLIFPKDIIQQTMLETTAMIGVLFLLLDAGLEINFSSAWKQRGNALIIAITDIVIPMIITFIPSYFLPDIYLVDTNKRLQFALFMAVAMTISAMPVASRALHDLKLLKTDLGFLIMSALAVNDIIGWALFTIILGLFTQSSFTFGSTLIILLATIGFSVLALTLGRYLSNKIIDFFIDKKLPEPSSSFTFACIVGIMFGAITQKIGIHALFGFFIAGVMVGEAKNLKEETRAIISQMVHSLFVPIFFVNIGLKMDFINNFDLFLVGLVTVVGIIGRYFGAWLGTSFSRVPSINRGLISIAHTPGGMMEIVVALLAFELNLITSKVFIAIVCGAVISSILVGPWMSYELRKRKKINLLKFIDLNNGLLFISADSKQEAIAELLKFSSSKLKNISIDKITDEIFQREIAFSTAIGNGIAIPHIRTDEIFEPFLLLGISKNGIDWNSPDGKPVKLIFFLLSPATTNDLHIEILSKIANIFQKKENIDRVVQANTTEELKTILKSICDYEA